MNPRSGPDDPRIGLKGGLYEAKTAILGMQLVMTTHKTAGYAPDDDSITAVDATPPPPLLLILDAPRQQGGGGPRPPSGPRANYGGTNSDLAFNAKYLFNGNYSGVNIYDISNPTQMTLVTSIICPGGQGDVSVYKNLLFMSVEAANGRMDCDTSKGFPFLPRCKSTHTDRRRHSRCRGDEGLPDAPACAQPGPNQGYPHIRHLRHSQSEAGG